MTTTEPLGSGGRQIGNWDALACRYASISRARGVIGVMVWIFDREKLGMWRRCAVLRLMGRHLS